MILIVTNREDFTADFAILEFRKRNIEFFRFNTEDYPRKAYLVWSYPENVKKLFFSGKTLDLSEVDSIWYRRPVNPTFGDDTPENIRNFTRDESREELLGLWRSINCLWVNHPDKNRLAENKIEQIHRAHSYGFRISPTLITNKSDSALDFIKNCNGRVIVKTLRQSFIQNSGRDLIIYTNIVDGNHLRHINLVQNCPVIFQAYVQKKSDIRVNVFGDEVYATEICSQRSNNEKVRVDWRRARINEIEHRPYELQEEIREKTIKYTRSYGLEFDAFDFVLSKDDELFFLELNPNGQWGWIEHLTKQPLREALVRLLTRRR